MHDPQVDIQRFSQPLCFKQRNEVTLLNNNNFIEFETPVIGILYCKNTIENSNWCKTPDEIDHWLKSHPFYFVNEDTRIHAEKWGEENYDKVDAHHKKFKLEIFPTIKSIQKDLNTINIDTEQRENGIFQYFDYYFGLNEVYVIENKWAQKWHGGTFMNILLRNQGMEQLDNFKLNGDLEGRKIVRLNFLQMSNEGEIHRR